MTAASNTAADRRRRRAERLTREPQVDAPALPAHAATAQPVAAGPTLGAPSPSRDTPAPWPIPPGIVEIPAAELARLRTAAAPERIAAERAQHERDSLITAAVRAGKVTPYEGRRWAAVLEADPGAAAALAAMPDGHSGVPYTPIWHAGGPETGTPTDWF